MRFLSLALLFLVPNVARAVLCSQATKEALLRSLSQATDRIASRQNVTTQFLRTVGDRIEACENRHGAQALSRDCTENLRNFIATYGQRKAPGHEYGFLIPDEEYLRDPARQVFLELPEEFRDGLPNNWREIATSRGWIFSEFSSSIVGNKWHASHRRLVFLIEGPGFDKWIQFTTPEPGGTIERFGIPERLINLITVEKGSSQPKLHFAEIARDIRGRNPQVHTFVSACYECHSNGMRAIVPAWGSATPEDRRKINYLNRKMESYGPIDWAGITDTRHLGPAYGRRQGCAECHNGYNDEFFSGHERSHINYYFDPEHLEARVVDLLAMPHGFLNSSRWSPLREALEEANRLTDEDRRIFLEYVTPSIFTGSWQKTELRRTLNTLRDMRALTPERHQEALRLLTLAQAEQRELYSTIEREFREDMRNWLLPPELCSQVVDREQRDQR